MGRAENRAYSRRKKVKAKKWLIWKGWGQFPQWPLTAKRVAKLARTPHPCSCMGCGNCRDWAGPPLQELRADERDKTWTD